ncbi:hypothetical protein BH11BAC1_BH11BAC1_15380 [soil metagenome]
MKTVYLAITFISLCLTAFTQTPTIKWQLAYGASNLTEKAEAIATDNSNNVFVAGSKYDPATQTYSLQVNKFNTSGTSLATLNISFSGRVTKLLIDNTGNVYLVASGTQAYLAKINNSLTAITWSRTVSLVNGMDNATAVIDSNSTVYLMATGGSYFGPKNFTVKSYNSAGTNVATYGTYGFFDWRKANAIALSGQFIYVCGQNVDSINSRGLITKLNKSNLTAVWDNISGISYSNTFFDNEWFAITVNPAGTNIYVAGSTWVSVTNTYKTVVKRFNDAGLVQSTYFHGNSTTYSSFGKFISLNQSGKVFVGINKYPMNTATNKYNTEVVWLQSTLLYGNGWLGSSTSENLSIADMQVTPIGNVNLAITCDSLNFTYSKWYFQRIHFYNNGAFAPYEIDKRNIRKGSNFYSKSALAVALYKNNNGMLTERDCAIAGYAQDGTNKNYFTVTYNSMLLREANEFTSAVSQPTNEFMLYPNPAENEINIQFETSEDVCSLEIINMEGQIVEQHTVTGDGIEIRNQFNISNLPKGFYMLRVSGKTDTQVKRFIKR